MYKFWKHKKGRNPYWLMKDAFSNFSTNQRSIKWNKERALVDQMCDVTGVARWILNFPPKATFLSTQDNLAILKVAWILPICCGNQKCWIFHFYSIFWSVWNDDNWRDKMSSRKLIGRMGSNGCDTFCSSSSFSRWIWSRRISQCGQSSLFGMTSLFPQLQK